ncbi:hypothetical protein DFH11DRAFT_1876538 [Phellopilus nigrolimitatus]|nr:hypothetical protein DFH11DRAFT_1876538 [Phellopilus nigrolimitatus]
MFSHTENVSKTAEPAAFQRWVEMRSTQVNIGKHAHPSGIQTTHRRPVAPDDDGAASDASDDAAPPPSPNPEPARLPQTQMQAGALPAPLEPTVSGLTPYKNARPARARRGRVVATEPRHRADASAHLGTLHEVQKRHPRDWANPGRVRVQFKRDERPANERIKTSAQAAPGAEASTPAKSQPAPKYEQGSSKPKGKGKLLDKAKDKDRDRVRARLSLARRVSAYSPALPSGVFVDTVKASLCAEAVAGGAPLGAGGKGKRKVVRRRG